jgi:hypothetical protein
MYNGIWLHTRKPSAQEKSTRKPYLCRSLSFIPHYQKPIRHCVPKSSSCVFYRAHGDVRRVPPLDTQRPTALPCVEVTTHDEEWSWPLLFDVCQMRAHGDYTSPPCALLWHTVKELKKSCSNLQMFSPLDMEHLVIYVKIWSIFVFVSYI